MKNSRDVLLCGFQCTGDGALHLGNLLGSALPFSRLSEEFGQSFCMVADLHALTSGERSANPRGASLRTARELCATVPDGVHVFRQSDVPEIRSIYTLLTMRVCLGNLERMTQFEEKSSKAGGRFAGLLLYPVLMAADILALGAAGVAVGEDQAQHVELARALRARLVADGAVLTDPRALTPDDAGRVKSLQNPLVKMSKSDSNQNACVFIDETPETTARKIARAVSDPEPLGTDAAALAGLDSRPGAKNLVGIVSGILGVGTGEALGIMGGAGFAKAKGVVQAEVNGVLAPIRGRLASIGDDQVERRLASGAAHARVNAKRVLAMIEGVVLGG